MNLILLGLPGAGKGTLAARIKREYGIPHISTGDIFRENIKNETALGLEAKKYSSEGKLVPDSVTNEMVKVRLSEKDVRNGFLLDGYPRTLNQANALNNVLASSNRSLDAVLYLKVSKDILMKRLTGRFMCSNCGATYHKLNNPPRVEGTCDQCGEHDFYQREDDKPEKVKVRIEENDERTEQLAAYYLDSGKLKEFDGEQSPQAIFQEAKDFLNK